MSPKDLLPKATPMKTFQSHSMNPTSLRFPSHSGAVNHQISIGDVRNMKPSESSTNPQNLKSALKNRSSAHLPKTKPMMGNKSVQPMM